jgi:TonB family protein
MPGCKWIEGRSLLLFAGMSLFASVVEAQEPQPIAGDEALVVEQGDGGRYWQRDPQQDKGNDVARYPVEMAKAGIDGCVNIGFVIQPDGTTAGFRVLKSSLADRRARTAFGAALVRVVSKQRFVPGPENPGRLTGFASTFADFSLGRKGVKDRECRIDDLKAFILAVAEGTPAG